MVMSRNWRSEILGRFADREDLGANEAYRRFWSQLPEADVLELFALLESEYLFPPGLLRPNDSLERLFQPVRTQNPLRWLIYRARGEDRMSEVNYQLAKRQRRHGTLDKWKRIDTVDDLIRAWCGLLPAGVS